MQLIDILSTLEKIKNPIIALIGGLVLGSSITYSSISKLRDEKINIYKLQLSELENKLKESQDRFISGRYQSIDEIEKNYVKLEKYQQLTNANKELNDKISEINSSINADQRLLAADEVWINKNPQFAISVKDYFWDKASDKGSIIVLTGFPDSQPSTYQFDRIGSDREWKFRYNGSLYYLYVRVVKSKEGFGLVEVNLKKG